MRARLSLPRVLLPHHARRMDGFCNQNADQLGSLAGPTLLTVYVGVVECEPASPYKYSSTHRFPDERTPIEATPLAAKSAELGLGLSQAPQMSLKEVWVWVWDWIHSNTPPRTRSPFSRPLLSHTSVFPRVH